MTDAVRARRWLQRLRAERLLVIVDRKVRHLYPDLPLLKLAGSRVVDVTATERHKTTKGVAALYDAFLDHAVTRRHTVVAVGGGITQDLVGFACHTYMRGLDWWFVPSTLLAQADSCIGSKTSINYQGSKNLLGSFYPPRQVVIDPVFLNTLTNSEVLSGLGEVVKVHCMDNRQSVAMLADDLPRLTGRNQETLSRYLRRSLAIKRRFIEADEFDRGVRQQLNYGHCFGHALESASGYRVPHGIAVAVGILFANRVSLLRKVLRSADEASMAVLIRELLGDYERRKIDADGVLFHMMRDKKRHGSDLTVILTRGPGRTFKAADVSVREFRRAFDSLEREGWW
ncbi:MAG: 3-dehydroquinate synthase [Vicinamibacterales bacterium]